MAKAEQKLDIFPHIFPPAFFERMKGIAAAKPALAANIKRWLNIPVLWDLEQRVKMMKRWPGYQQVLTLSLPAIEFLADENESPALGTGQVDVGGRLLVGGSRGPSRRATLARC